MAIYLDNNATTPLAPEVLEEMLPTFTNNFGNPASKSHSFGWFAAELVELARERVATLVGAKPEHVVFTSGATEANNLVLKGLSPQSEQTLTYLSAATEHSSILDPIQYMCSEGARVDYLQIDEEGHIGTQQAKEQITSLSPSVITLMLANNEIGTIHSLDELFKAANKLGAISHCDATQALGKIDIDIEAMNIDALSISAHKIYGPKGVGALVLKDNSRTRKLEAQLHGGGHERGLRSGTLNVPGIVGFGKACELASKNMKSDVERIQGLQNLFLAIVKEAFPEVTLNGSMKSRLPGNLNLSIPGLKSQDLIAALSTSIAFSTSSACQSSSAKPSHVLAALGISEKRQEEAFRIGIGRYNKQSEIELSAKKIVDFAKKRLRLA